MSNSSCLVGEDEGNWNSPLQKNGKLSVFPPPHTFALQLCAGNGGTGTAVLWSPFLIMTPDLFAVFKWCEIILRGMPNADLDRVRLLFAYLKLLWNESPTPPQW